jgi:hypothetical protein
MQLCDVWKGDGGKADAAPGRGPVSQPGSLSFSMTRSSMIGCAGTLDQAAALITADHPTALRRLTLVVRVPRTGRRAVRLFLPLGGYQFWGRQVRVAAGRRKWTGAAAMYVDGSSFRTVATTSLPCASKSLASASRNGKRSTSDRARALLLCSAWVVGAKPRRGARIRVAFGHVGFSQIGKAPRRFRAPQ